MSKFKRSLSAILAVIMMLSSVSCLGSVVSFGAASYVEGKSVVKSYEELSTQYSGKNFLYMAVDYYEESNGKLTDYYVDKGEILDAFLYIKSNLYFKSATLMYIFDNTVFDHIYGADGETLATTVKIGETEFNIASAQQSAASPDKVFETFAPFAMNTKHPAYTSDAGIRPDLYTDQLATTTTIKFSQYYAEITPYENLDLLKLTTKKDTTADKNAYAPMTSDDYFMTLRLKVIGEEGKTGIAQFNPYLYKVSDTSSRSNKAGDMSLFNGTSNSTNIAMKTYLSYTGNDETDTFLCKDAMATFTVGKNPAGGGGGDTATHTAKFVVDGQTVSSDSFAEGAAITKPASDPSKTGAQFAGWAVEGTTTPVTTFTMGKADVTYVALFKYAATFVVDGAAFGEVKYYLPGEAITAPASSAVAKTGYDFNGWSPAVGTMGNAAATFTAQYTAKTYNVYFMTDSSTSYINNTVKFNGSYNTNIGTPSKTGYIFNGWVDSKGDAMPATHTIDGDVTYLASFTKGTFNAVFNANNGQFADGSTSKTVSVEFGAAITAPAAPTRSGYSFNGWNPTVGTMDAEGKTFTAQWKAAEVGVTFMDGDKVIETKTGSFGSQIAAIPNPEKEGYDFGGWVDGAGKTVSFPVTLGADAIVVYAKWNAKQIYIDFLVDNVSAGSGYQYCGETLQTPGDQSKVGHTFNGWVDASGAAAPEKVPTKATTYYASFTPIKYKATFNVQGAYYDSVEADYGATFAAPKDPEVNGYEFKGWLRSGTQSTKWTAATTMPYNGVTYEAILEAKTYNVKYYVDNVEKYATTAKFGDTVPAYTYTPASGESFSGWKLADGSAVPATMPANDLLIYGTTGAAMYTVTFNINGELFKTSQFAYGEKVTAPEYTPETGYTFSGWTVPDTMPARDITLNATLTKETYTLNYYKFQGDETPYATYQLNYNDTLPTVGAPEIPGYEFVKWDTAYTTMPASNLDVYAKLNQLSYTVKFVDADGNDISGYVWTAKHYGDTIAAADVPTVTKEGSTFKFWKVNDERANFPYTVGGNTTFVPYFSTSGYDVNYYVDGELKYTDTFEYGQTIVYRAALTKTGYTFSGWAGKTAQDILPETMPAANVDVYGTFTANKYNAKFYLSEADRTAGTAWKTIPTDYGTIPVIEETPTKTGYTFLGWAPVLSKMTEAGAEYVARFSAGTVKYTVSIYTMGTNGEYGNPEVKEFDADTDETVRYDASTKVGFTLDTNGSVLTGKAVAGDTPLNLSVYYIRNQYTFTVSVDGSPDKDTKYYYEQAVQTPADGVKEGYTFKGWDGTVPATMPAKDVKVAAKFAINQYSLVFDTKGGSTVRTITANYGAAISKPADPTKDGYDFDGWDSDIPATMPALGVNGATKTITAKWKAKQFTITFANTGDTTIEPITADFGTAIVAPAAPTKKGYTFAGWDIDVPKTMPASSLTITAQWTANKYDAIFVIDGQEVKVPTAYGEIPVAPEAVKKGYEFTGWDNELVAIGTEGATYTAEFTANSYDAIFNAAGGKFADDSLTKTVKDVEFDTAITAPADPTREGYQFNGWSPEVDKMTEEGMTFEAQWIQDLNYCRVKEVTRVTTPVYEDQVANYAIKVEGSPVKVMFAMTGVSATWTYDRKDTPINTAVGYETGLVSIVAYDKDDQETTNPDEVAYEIWTVRAVFTEGKYRVRAKVNHDESSWESMEVAKEFENIYDIKPVDTTVIKSSAVDVDTVKRGEYVTFTVVAKEDVNRIRFVRETEDGLKAVTFSSDVADENVSISAVKDGYKTWTIKVKLSYTGTDEYEMQTWAIQYRLAGEYEWIDSDKGDFEIKVTRFEEVDEEGQEIVYEVISIDAAESVNKGEYSSIVIVTSANVERVKLSLNGKSATYLKTSKNCSVAEKDGNLVWTINYRFAVSGQLTYDVQVRGDEWSELTDASHFSIEVVA